MNAAENGRHMQHWPMGYHEIVPSTGLASHVLRLWAYAIPPSRDPSTAVVIPDGCADIIWVDDRPPIVVGPMTALAPSWPAPGSLVIGARLRPGLAGLVLGEDCQGLTDREIPLAAIWGDSAARELEHVIEAPSLPARFAAIELSLLDRLVGSSGADPVVLRSIDWLRQCPGDRLQSLIDDLDLGVSERQLRRRFVRAVGYGPKTFQRIMRVQHCLSAMQSQPRRRVDLSSLAVEAGYTDQSHMTREFHQLTGKTPRATVHAHATAWLD